MKYCKNAYEYLYLDTYEGNVALCPWMFPEEGVIGNLLEEDFEKIWFSEKAQKLRDAHTENCFKYCRPQGCPYIQNNDLPEIQDNEEYKKLTVNREYPTTINLAHDFICNQSCETCRSSVFVPPKDYAEKMNKIREKIAPYLDKAKMITASGHGDPFASPYMTDLLAKLNPNDKNMVIQLETNGVFFDEEHWEKIKHLKEINLKVVVTVNSYDKFTYEHISRGGNYEKLMKNLNFISELRKTNDIKEFVVAAVVQDRNFRQMPEFIEHTFAKYAVDHIILRPVYQWGTMPEKTFWFKDVLNPKHPYHAEYLEILQHPALKDGRVYNFGGDTVHPERDFYIEEPCSCCCEEKSTTKTRKIVARIASSLIPERRIRRKVRDKIMYGQ